MGEKGKTEERKRCAEGEDREKDVLKPMASLYWW